MFRSRKVRPAPLIQLELYLKVKPTVNKFSIIFEGGGTEDFLREDIVKLTKRHLTILRFGRWKKYSWDRIKSVSMKIPDGMAVRIENIEI